MVTNSDIKNGQTMRTDGRMSWKKTKECTVKCQVNERRGLVTVVYILVFIIVCHRLFV